MNALIDRFLEHRGYDASSLAHISSQNYGELLDIDTLCLKLHDYRIHGKHLVLASDFDVDGIMSGVLGFAGLSELGFRVSLYRPSTESYGFAQNDVDAIVTQYPDVSGILTADVGISSFEGIARAKDLGLDFFVTDHHMWAGENQATVVVDPQRPDDINSYAFICGARVLHRVLLYYAAHFHERSAFMVSQMERLCVFSGIGTIADAMPLHHENRRLVQDAVAICRWLFSSLDDNTDVEPSEVSLDGCSVYQKAFSGLLSVLKVFQAAGKIQQVSDINEEFFGFYFAPAFNSIKRLNEDVSDAYLVFFGSEEDSMAFMEYILQLNEKRKELVKNYVDQILSMTQPYVPYIYLCDAPSGLLGLLAQRIMSETHLPVLVLTQHDDGSLSGSGRCPSWFPFIDAVQSLDYVSALGHNAAFGCRLISANYLSDMCSFMRTYCEEHAPDDNQEDVNFDYTVSSFGDGDSMFDLSVMLEFLHYTDSLRPFGSGFTAPVGHFVFAREDCIFRLIGHDKKHLRISLPGGINMLCFNQAERLNKYESLEYQFSDTLEAYGKLCWNDYNGVRSLQIQATLTPDSFVSDEDEDMLVFSGGEVS